MVKFILFLFLFYIGFKLFSRLIYFYLVRKVSKKHSKHKRNEDVKRREGEVSIDKMPKKNKSKSEKLGDYVDYEEID